MESKTLFFNKAVFLRNIRQNLVFLAFITIFNTALLCGDHLFREIGGRPIILDYEAYVFGFYVAIEIGLITSVFVFNYLYMEHSIAFYHGLPIKRENLLGGFICSGIAIITIAYIIMCVTDVTVLYFRIVDFDFSLFEYYLYCYVVTITGMAVALVFIIISGSIKFGIIYYIAYMFGAELIKAFVKFIIGGLLLPDMIIDDIKVNAFSAILMPSFLIPDGEQRLLKPSYGFCILFLCIITVLALMLSFILYKKRKSEAVGEAVTIKFLKKPVQIVVSLFTGLLVVVSLRAFIDNPFINITKTKFIIVLVFTLSATICFSACEIISKWKKTNKKQGFINIGIFVICAALIMISFIGLTKYFIERPSSESKYEKVLVFFAKDYRVINMNEEKQREFFVIDDKDGIKSIIDYTNYFIDNIESDYYKQQAEMIKGNQIKILELTGDTKTFSYITIIFCKEDCYDERYYHIEQNGSKANDFLKDFSKYEVSLEEYDKIMSEYVK